VGADADVVLEVVYLPAAGAGAEPGALDLQADAGQQVHDPFRAIVQAIEERLVRLDRKRIFDQAAGNGALSARQAAARFKSVDAGEQAVEFLLDGFGIFLRGGSGHAGGPAAIAGGGEVEQAAVFGAALAHAARFADGELNRLGRRMGFGDGGRQQRRLAVDPGEAEAVGEHRHTPGAASRQRDQEREHEQPHTMIDTGDARKVPHTAICAGAGMALG